MNELWKTAWESVNEEFGEIARELTIMNRALWWTCGHTDNEVFPFRAYATFNKVGVAGDEDIVISLDFKRGTHTIQVSSDISRGSGEIVVDGPADDHSLAMDAATIRTWITDSTAKFTAFVNANHAVLIRRPRSQTRQRR